MASLEDLYEDESKDNHSDDDDDDSSCTPMCQQMSLIEHPLSTLSLSNSLSPGNITQHNEKIILPSSDYAR